MMQDLLEFTVELYRLSALFPQKDPLRYKMREIGLDILADFLRVERDNNPGVGTTAIRLKGNLKIIDSFFELIKQQSWVKQDDILRLQAKYHQLSESLTVAVPVMPTPVIPAASRGFSENPPAQKVGTVPTLAAKGQGVGQEPALDDRQKKVLRILREKRTAQIGELAKSFPGVSRRTIQRDLDKLNQMGLVSKQGNGRASNYAFV